MNQYYRNYENRLLDASDVEALKFKLRILEEHIKLLTQHFDLE